jgi:hypothetical protein
LKPAQANSSRDPISKIPITKKRAGGVAQGKGPEFKPQYCKIIIIKKYIVIICCANSKTWTLHTVSSRITGEMRIALPTHIWQ